MNNTWNKERALFNESFPQLREIEHSGKKMYIFDSVKWSIPFNLEGSIKFNEQEILDVFKFAFHGKDKHRDNRSGGSIKRTPTQKFFNIFLGKLGEIATQNSFVKNGVKLRNPVDYEVRERNDWDDCDIITLNGKKINVKSSKHSSDMLLLEIKDYNKKGELIYNIGTDKASSFDYFTYVRVAPLKYGRIDKIGYFKDIDESRETLFKFIKSFNWVYEEPFIITNKLLVDNPIKNNYIVKKDNLVKFDLQGGVLGKLSKKRNTPEQVGEYITKMSNSFGYKLDADNYYFPIKYMGRISQYINDL